MKLSQVCLLAVIVLSTVACGKIPAAYQGDFEDAAQQSKLTLTGDSGTFIGADGKKIEAKAEDITFEQLQEGKTGIFLGTNPQDGRLFDVDWIIPNIATKQEVVMRDGSKMVSYNAEMIYTLIDSKREDKVPSIQLIHCKDGMVVLHASTKRYIRGCPAAPTTYDMKRKSS